MAKLGVTNGVKGSGLPYIDTGQSSQNETILVGKQIILRCHIEDAGNQSVRQQLIKIDKGSSHLLIKGLKGQEAPSSSSEQMAGVVISDQNITGEHSNNQKLDKIT